MDDLRIYRNRLPHWRTEGACYFVGWNLQEGERDLESAERTLVANAVKHFDAERYDLCAWVVMNDHAHALLFLHESWELEQVLHSWKSFTVNQMQRKFGRKGRIWQKDSFNRIVRNDEEWLEKQRYIMNNPYKRWPEITSYKWVWPVEQQTISFN